MPDWKDINEYNLKDDLVQVLCEVTKPVFADPDFHREDELPISSGDHAVGERYVSIGHANESIDGNGELVWWVAGWNMEQDCWEDARCFRVLGWQPIAILQAAPCK